MLGQNGKIFGDVGIQGRTSERVYLGSQLVFLKNPDLFTPLPVVFWDKEKEEMLQTQDLNDIDVNRYEPIGIVVIPAEHDVYGTGECGVMALKYASILTPDEGYTEANFASNHTEHDPAVNGPQVGSLYNNVPVVDKNNTFVGYGVTGQYNAVSYGHIPTDNYDVYNNDYDNPQYKGTYYHSDGYNWCPSPLLSDGTINSLFFDKNSPTGDFDGFNKTIKMINSISDESWKTTENLIDWKTYQAACACWRFSTPGTNNGDWYLPACGELVFMRFFIKKLYKTLLKLKSVFKIQILNEILTTDFNCCTYSFRSVLDSFVIERYKITNLNNANNTGTVAMFTRMTPPKKLVIDPYKNYLLLGYKVRDVKGNVNSGDTPTTPFIFYPAYYNAYQPTFGFHNYIVEKDGVECEPIEVQNQIDFNELGCTSCKIRVQFPENRRLTSLQAAFWRCMGLCSMDFSHLYCDAISSMKQMAYGAVYLRYLNYEGCDFSSCTNFDDMFFGNRVEKINFKKSNWPHLTDLDCFDLTPKLNDAYTDLEWKVDDVDWTGSSFPLLTNIAEMGDWYDTSATKTLPNALSTTPNIFKGLILKPGSIVKLPLNNVVPYIDASMLDLSKVSVRSYEPGLVVSSYDGSSNVYKEQSFVAKLGKIDPNLDRLVYSTGGANIKILYPADYQADYQKFIDNETTDLITFEPY